MSAAHSPEQAHGGHGAGPGHIVNPAILIGVLVALLVLTFCTVAVTWVDLGEFNLLIAMIIAVIKGSLVCLFFMHMYWDKPIIPIVFISSLLLVGLFIGLAAVDYGQYQPDPDRGIRARHRSQRWRQRSTDGRWGNRAGRGSRRRARGRRRRRTGRAGSDRDS